MGEKKKKTGGWLTNSFFFLYILGTPGSMICFCIWYKLLELCGYRNSEWIKNGRREWDKECIALYSIRITWLSINMGKETLASMFGQWWSWQQTGMKWMLHPFTDYLTRSSHMSCISYTSSYIPKVLSLFMITNSLLFSSFPVRHQELSSAFGHIG